MSFVKDNGGMLAVGAVALVIAGALADWRIGVKVEDALAEQGFATNDKIVELEEDIGRLEKADNDQKAVHKDDRDRMDSKIERIVDILLEE